LILGVAAAVLMLAAVPVPADDFRIETELFEGDQEKPVSKTVTLFHGGIVYDFLASPRQIAVFRRPAADRPGRFILLDLDHEIRTELTTDRIDGLLTKLRDWAAEQPNPVLRFAAAPHFEETFEAKTGELVLASYIQTYRLKTTSPGNPELLAEYREFLDWYARLNTIMHGGPPPEPRLQVNAALVRHGVVPVSVELSRPANRIPVRAQHEFVWRLSRQDHTRIDEVREAMTSYKLVSNEEFLERQAQQEGQ
jgi:hypothetical protein